MTAEEVGKAVAGVLGVIMLSFSLQCAWLFFAAPYHDGEGIVCEQASMARSMGAALRGRREVGCAADGAITERPFFAPHLGK